MNVPVLLPTCKDIIQATLVIRVCHSLFVSQLCKFSHSSAKAPRPADRLAAPLLPLLIRTKSANLRI